MIARILRFALRLAPLLVISSAGLAATPIPARLLHDLPQRPAASWDEEFERELSTLLDLSTDVPEEWHEVGPPANDGFANATTIAIVVDSDIPPRSTFGDNIDATKEPGEPQHRGNAGGKSVWWKWTTPFPARVQLMSSNSNFSTLLAVYTGSTVNALNPVAYEQFAQQDDSRFVFSAFPGTTYFIAVDGVDGQSGQIDLQLWGGAASPPTILTQPVDITAAYETHVTLSVTASGTSPITYQWYRNGQSLPHGDQSFLALFPARPADSGNYHVVVSSPFGTVTSRTATVSVAGPPAPQITLQPVSMNVPAGEDIFLTSDATGLNPLAFQWYFNGNPLPNEVSRNLRVLRAQPVHSGHYTVTVTNIGGTVTSAVAEVIVGSGTAPTFTTHPATQAVVPGATVTFTAAAHGLPAVRYEWRHNGTTIANATGATLTLTNVQAANAGSYVAVAINSMGTVTSNAATLTVSAASNPGPAPGGGGGGGGSHSLIFLVAACGLLLQRLMRSPSRR